MKATEICNPAWDIWKRVYGPSPKKFCWNQRLRFDEPFQVDQIIDDHYLRQHVIDHMTFAIPDPRTLELIANHGPIVEIGAGTGYWAWCLRQMGVDVIAFDRYPPQTHPRDENRSKGRNGWFDSWWTDVRRGTAGYSRRYPERSLLMVWPYMNDMALRALKAYRGNTVIFVGEERAACATAAFFDLLDEEWTRIVDQVVPQWSGIHDELWILKRMVKRS